MKVRALAEWAIVLASVAACSGGEATKPPPTPVPTSIQLSATSVSLRIAESRQLTATVLDQQNRPMTGQAITWSTSDTTKVNVDDAGLVRGVRVGSATLTARSGALSASAAATVLAPATQIETAAAVTATIGEQGGAITAQAGNGTRFTLTVPPLAVTSDTGITLTPITTIENLPLGATLVTALRLQPDGLEFLAPATLTIDLPAAAAPSGLFGLRFADDWSFTLTPIAVTGTRLTMSIAHFSGAGAGYLTCPPNIPISGTPRDIALSDLAIEQCKAQSTGSWNAAAVINILHKWYTVSVKPNLQGASSSTTANASFGEWAEWRHTIDNYLSVVGPISSLNQDVAEAAPLAVAVVKGEIARQNQKCIADQDLHAAHKVFLWQLKAQAELIATSANGLDVATVQAGICVKVEIDQTNFPDPVQEGTAATLTVQAGLRFGTGSVVYSRPLEVSVTVTGAAPASGVKMTNSAGQATFSVTPSPGGSTVRVDIHVALKTQQLDAYGVFRNTTVVRQASVVSVNINPSAAILNPGTQATFTATVTGVQNTAVTWTATGGTITAGGVYTAGQTAGVYQVKATSVGHPLKSGTAQVTIIAPSPVYQTDFSGTVGTEWSSQNVTQSPNGQRFLGEFQNRTVTLTLNQLPPHTKVTLEFDFYAIDTWDGNHSTDGPDVFTVSVQNGPVLKTTTFSTVTQPGYEQAFPGNYPGSSFAPGSGGSANVLGYPPNNNNSAGFLGDAVYSLPFTFDHTGGAIVVEFRVSANTTSLTDERWGIDNVRVSVVP